VYCRSLTSLQDAGLAATISLTLAILVMLIGDPLYLGIWYYLIVPTVVIGLCTAIRPAPMFRTGTALAITTSFLSFMSINWSAAKPEGLLGLGHIFSLPGGVMGAVSVAIVARRMAGASPWAQFLLGFGGFGLGYFMNQLVICNTVMWCGVLSGPTR
jgi:hypothetical protein